MGVACGDDGIHEGFFTHDPRAVTISCEGPLLLSIGHTTDMICHILCLGDILEEGLMQIMAEHETLSTVAM